MEPPKSTQEISASIAQQLGETAGYPRDQISRIVRRLGTEAALAFLAQTMAIEAQGGLLLPDGSRRRTPGGVFFHLVRTLVSPEDRDVLFPPKRWPKQRARAERAARAARAEEPTAPPLAWSERLPVLQELLQTKGAATTVKITLIGRPGKIVQKGETIITAMQTMKVPPLPKGLPTPPATPTTYTVYIARKQWKNVEAAIANPDDALIIEGFAAYDPELEGIAVFTTNVTTKQLQAAKRQATPPAGGPAPR